MKEEEVYAWIFGVISFVSYVWGLEDHNILKKYTDRNIFKIL